MNKFATVFISIPAIFPGVLFVVIGRKNIGKGHQSD